MRSLLPLLLLMWGCTPSAAPSASSPPPASAPPSASTPASADVSTDLDHVPPVTQADEALAGAFQLLDGRWRGTFRVYADTRGQQPGPRRVLPAAVLQSSPYRLELEVAVEQEYVSESPYFQRVSIRDVWTSQGERHEVRSRGLNKVQGGALWCVVHKPDDLVLHAGDLVRPNTIVWSRDRREPLAVEHFEERVTAKEYTIRGWGYYGSDNPALAPKTYFDASYTRPK
jgi:hypothetical protein